MKSSLPMPGTSVMNMNGIQTRLSTLGSALVVAGQAQTRTEALPHPRLPRPAGHRAAQH